MSHPQQFRHRLQLHHQPARRFAVNPAVNQCLRHDSNRHLYALKIRQQVCHLALRPALPAHLRYRFCQHRPPRTLSAHRGRQLPCMRIANVRAFLRRGFALLSIPAEHLAPPVIGVPRLRNSFWRWLCRC